MKTSFSFKTKGNSISYVVDGSIFERHFKNHNDLWSFIIYAMKEDALYA
jgi:hypothetical protein